MECNEKRRLACSPCGQPNSAVQTLCRSLLNPGAVAVGLYGDATLFAVLVSAIHSVHADWSYGWTLLLAIPAAGMYVMFIIQNDCGHGSYFGSSRASRWVGACLGGITVFPFSYWKRTHACPHQILFKHRIPFDLPLSWTREGASVLLINAMLGTARLEQQAARRV